METIINKLSGRETVTCEEYLETYASEIIPESEKVFVRDFLFSILGEEKMPQVVPQYPFIDSEGKSRRIDFGIITDEGHKIAFEVNGETYHGEGIIPSAQFDDNLFRQNEILFHGWVLRRYSYNQLLDPVWRTRVANEIRLTLKLYAPELLPEVQIKPNEIQREVLSELKTKRALGWHKGLVIMPTGTGKTYLSALDALQYNKDHPNAKFLFVVHRLEILSQSRAAYSDVWGKVKFGFLGGGTAENVEDCKILFASKDSLYREETLNQFAPDYFDYIIVDEVHHGESKTYRIILDYFTPDFLLGITATPDRTDKKDILELFDYQKVSEYTLNDAIEKGFLVSYEYHGLKDNIDYTNIRWNGVKYDTKDLENHLIINERNEMIFNKYMELCQGNKTIGFCVGIKHAQRMADFFNARGVSAVAIFHDPKNPGSSKSKIQAFRDNQYAVAFTVDMFNEGVDIPNVQCLLFLRPTESKTVFLQQIGRGLRLSSNKDRIIILDFIGNYKRANLVRQYLSKGVSEKTKDGSNAFEKFEYEYNPKCKVVFDDEVQAVLDYQDEQNHNINEDDLTDAYFDLKTKLGRKPTIEDINNEGKYKVSKYAAVFGSWIKFLRSVGEITENGYHYPQGLHIGHIMYILKALSEKDTSGYMNERFIRMRGDLSDDGDLATFQRQTKYKLQGMMGMGLLTDDRKNGLDIKMPELTALGTQLYEILKPVIDTEDLSFKVKAKGFSWEMTTSTAQFIEDIRKYLNGNAGARKQYMSIMFNFDAVKQLLNFLYFDSRQLSITKANCYQLFIESLSVEKYCESQGIEIPTAEGAKHRVPFLVTLLETMDIVNTDRSNVQLNRILIADFMFENHADVFAALSNRTYTEEIKERFGTEFLSQIRDIKMEVI